MQEEFLKIAIKLLNTWVKVKLLIMEFQLSYNKRRNYKKKKLNQRKTKNGK
jgi:hypothetical protein